MSFETGATTSGGLGWFSSQVVPKELHLKVKWRLCWYGKKLKGC